MSNNNDDAIGQTIYSKQWTIKLVKKIVEFVDKEGINQSPNEIEIDSLEDELSILWEMSSNEDVQKFLLEFDIPMLTFALMKTKNERVAELLIGILANLVHNKEISDLISNDESFCWYTITLLSASDIPFLTQLIRFLNTILLRTDNDHWLSLIEKNADVFFHQIDYLFSNCLNDDLLKALFRYINDLLYKNNDLGKHWHQSFSWPNSLCNAISHLVNDVDIDNETFFHFWFIVQALSRDSIDYLTQSIPNLYILLDLFQQFDQLIDFNSVNSINSLSAACLIFIRLNSIEYEHSNGDEWKNFKEDMINNKIIENISIKFAKHRHQRTIEEVTDNDTYNDEQILSNIDEFFQIFTKQKVKDQ